MGAKKAVNEVRSQPWGIVLFPLHRSRRFGGYIVNYSVYMVYFVCYPVGYPCEDVIWYLCPIGCHKVVCCYGPDSYKVVIGSVVAHYAYCLYVRQNCKELAQAALKSAFLDLVTENGVCFLQYLYLYLLRVER